MIPFFELREIPIGGGHSIAVFGLLVCLGVVLGVVFAQSRARALGVPDSDFTAAAAWALIPGFLLSHIVAIGFYEAPGERGLLHWLEFWNGMSSFGGFLGALLGLVVYFGLLRRRTWLSIADVFIQGLTVGWVFGRLGCTLVHDHIGKLSDFPLAIRFPDGLPAGLPDGARHDLGFYELLYTVIVLVPALIWLNRRPRRPGTAICLLSLLYVPARFLGDFLRIDLLGYDPRYGGLTPAQYACIAVAGLALALAYRLRRASSAGLRGQSLTSS
jgi:phosphatidylglycerol:prolipoprotein diacylglycerol transferase